MEDVQEHQKPKVETVENNEQEQNENANQNQTQNNDEQSETDASKNKEDERKKKEYEEQQIARINLIFGNPTDLQNLYKIYAEEFQVIAQKRVEVESVKSESNTENDNDKQENNDNDNETQESEPKTAGKELKDAEKEFAGRWGLNPEELSDKIEVLQVGCVATVVPEDIDPEKKKVYNAILEKAQKMKIHERLDKFKKYLEENKGIEVKLEIFANGMANFSLSCDAEATFDFLEQFDLFEKREKIKESLQKKAEEAKKKAEEQAQNSNEEQNNEQNDNPVLNNENNENESNNGEHEEL